MRCVTGNSVVRLPEDAGTILFLTKAKTSLQPIQLPVQFVPEQISSGVKWLRLLAEQKFSCNAEDTNGSCKVIRNIQNKK
jgi:hypothetical protein